MSKTYHTVHLSDKTFKRLKEARVVLMKRRDMPEDLRIGLDITVYEIATIYIE